MIISPVSLSNINNEVAEKLRDMLKQIESDGVESLGFNFAAIDYEDLLSTATDALASGNLLGAVALSVIDSMDVDFTDE